MASPAPPIPTPSRPRNRAPRPCGGTSGSRAGRSGRSIFLGHPGPSLLVTVVLVAIAGLAGHGLPDGTRILQLVGAMLPVQLCIGVINDVVDLPADAVAKPHKPLVRGVWSPIDRDGRGHGARGDRARIAATINLGDARVRRRCALARASPTTWGCGGRRFPGCPGGAGWQCSRSRDTRQSGRSHRGCSSSSACPA